jgi:hypothetical protein
MGTTATANMVLYYMAFVTRFVMSELRRKGVRTCAAFMIAVSWSGVLWANGRHFFAPAGKNATVDLVYFGTIRDRATGRPLDFVDLSISAKNIMMTFPFFNDRPGHYRSPDIGLMIKDVGEAVDTKQLEIECYVEGYKRVTRSMPRRSRGTIEINFLLEKEVPTSTTSVSEAPLPRARSWRVPTLGLLVLFLSAVVARTSTRPRSTMH